MIGLLYLLFLAAYIGLWRLVVRRTRTWAIRTGRPPRRWAGVAHLGMFLLIFWDLIPTYATYGYYCLTRAGFEQYQTLDQWKAENPGVAQTLRPVRNAEEEVRGNLTRVPLNQRFAWDTVTRLHPFHVRERDERIVDTRTGQILARYVNFDTDILGVERGNGARGLYDYKFWLQINSCSDIGLIKPRKSFIGLRHLIEFGGELQQ